MAELGYTPQEAAAVTGAALTAIQKAISERAVPARTAPGTRRRQLDETGVLAFALAEAMPPELRVSPRDAYRLLQRTSADDPGTASGGEVRLGEAVRIDLGKALGEARRRLRLYRRARELVVRDPAILGGTPVIRGTRLTAQAILGRLQGGDTIESVLEDYPYLDRETVEAAALWALANPARGRPRGRLCRRGS